MRLPDAACPDRAQVALAAENLRLGASGFLHAMETLHRLWDRTRSVPAATATNTTFISGVAVAEPAPETWERLIADRMLPSSHRPFMRGDQLTQSDDDSFELYAKLAKEFRFGAIADLLRNSMRLLLIALGETAVRELLEDYTAIAPPSAFPSDEALNFR
jgi:hypothetical protein